LFSQFQLVADALRNMKDGTDKTAAAYKLFGGRNIELLTAIENGTMGMDEQFQMAERLGLVMSKEVVAGVEAANDSMSLLKLGVVGLSQQFSAALAPAILRVSDNIRESLLHWVEKTHGSIQNFGDYLATKLIKGLFEFAEVMIHVGTAVTNTAIAMGNLGVAAQNVGKLFTIGDWGADWVEFNKFVKVSDESLQKLKRTFDELTTSGDEDFGKVFSVEKLEKARAKIEARELESVNKRKKIQNELYSFEEAKMKSQEKAYEENEKKKKELRTQGLQDMRSNLEGTLTIMSGSSKKAFKMLQAHKIAEAIVNTYSAVMKAFAAFTPPMSYLAAGSALTFGMAQVGQIRAQKFTARRQGGAVSENKPYMVGEGGPEMFIPNQGGFISPGMGGKSVNVTFNINAVDTTGFQQLLANERGMIVGMINSAVNQQGKSDII